uniref:Ig-like domain-containing protein n=1 Tax=Esox lucius TaxID=8010 RepID=A0A3P8YZ90_ESOLU
MSCVVLDVCHFFTYKIIPVRLNITDAILCHYLKMCFQNKRLALTNDVTQPDPMVVTHSGRSVSLTCFCPSEMIMNVLWLKQTFGQKPLLMASSYHYSQESSYFNKFIKDFNKTKRLSVKRAEDSFNLTISKTEPGDSATYYCAALIVNEIRIAEGTVLYVKVVFDYESKRIFALALHDLNMSVLQQPVSESVQPGESVTLNCTINTGTCEREHSVYWFRHDSGESHPGIIYTNGDRSGQCMKSPESGSPTQSCVYNLPKRNLSLSDTGTYSCAVASCGEILFGNGTKLNVGDPLGNQINPLLIVISFLTTAVILSVIINVIFCMRMKRSQCEHCAGTVDYILYENEEVTM